MPDVRFTSCGSSEKLRDQFNAPVDDYDELRTQFVALLVKLDADAGTGDLTAS